MKHAALALTTLLCATSLATSLPAQEATPPAKPTSERATANYPEPRKSDTPKAPVGDGRTNTQGAPTGSETVDPQTETTTEQTTGPITKPAPKPQTATSADLETETAPATPSEIPDTTQAPDPKVEVTLSETDVIPGQAVTLRIEVLVPTWMPSPPIYPDFSHPDMMVRLPERATQPTSERIGGDTWSGTIRSYKLIPMVPGAIDLPGGEIALTYADPATNAPIEITVPFDPVTINATVPEAAKDLSPFIAATSFTLDQQIEGETDMQAGDAVTRTITATVKGTTPIMIPDLGSLVASDDPLLRAYPQEPKLSETDDRGQLSGSRVQTVSYLAQAGGSTQLPAISLEWFNIESGSVETAQLPATDLTIKAAPPPPPDPWKLAAWGAALLAAVLLAWKTGRYLAPYLRDARARRTARIHASEAYAAGILYQAMTQRNLGDTLDALNNWSKFHADVTSLPDWSALEDTLARIGAAQYGAHPNPDHPWGEANAAFQRLRSQLNAQSAKSGATLPGLNPAGPSTA